MLIRKIEIYKSPIRLKEPFIISLGPLYHAENIIVVIRTDEEISGFGESSPFRTINGESIDTCFVVGEYLGHTLIGKDPLDIESCHSLMDKTIFGNSSIKSAFDIALYDIASQKAGLPLYAFLGGEKNKELITDYTVSLGSPEKMADDAAKIVTNGFQVIKVKLGNIGANDVGRVKKIRERIGSDIPLRIDANQGWSRNEAVSTLKELKDYNIQFCEEPIPRWDFMNLPDIKLKKLIPVMADESCCDHHDAERLIRIEAADYFNVKLGKSSGIYKALKIIRLAEKAGMQLQVGGFLESRLGFTASAHLALSSDNIKFCDFDTPLMLQDDPVVGGITYGPKGEINVPEKPGTGATVDEKYLKTLTYIIVE
jgi:L-Ala-D/L-Glu epimerase